MADTIILDFKHPTGKLYKLLVSVVNLANAYKFVNFGTHDDDPEPDAHEHPNYNDGSICRCHDYDDPDDYDDAGTDNDHEYPTLPEFT